MPAEPLAVVADADSGPQGVDVPLVYVDGKGKSQEVTFTVPPAGKWRGSAVELFYSNRYLGWAKTVLDKDAAEQIQKLDPTVNELAAFANEWIKRAGETPGK